MLNLITLWFKAARAPFFTAIIAPILVGAAAAYWETNSFHTYYFILTLIGGLFIQAGINLINDYWDHLSGADALVTPEDITPFSAGSRVIQQKILTPQAVLRAALTCFAYGILIGLYLAYTRGWWILILGIIGVISGYFNTGWLPRTTIGGWGEPLLGLNFGPITLLGAFYVQAQKFNLHALMISLPIALLITAVLYINEFPDYDADRRAGKKTLVVIWGKKQAVKGYVALLVLAEALIILAVTLKIIPIPCLLALLLAPLTCQAIKTLKTHYHNSKKLIPAQKATILLHFFTGLLLCAGYLLDKLI